MDLDQRLRQQDLYDLCLCLSLALPYAEYQRFVEASFAWAGVCVHMHVCAQTLMRGCHPGTAVLRACCTSQARGQPAG